jgi:hypothetical protein
MKYVGRLASNNKVFDQTRGSKAFSFRLGAAVRATSIRATSLSMPVCMLAAFLLVAFTCCLFMQESGKSFQGGTRALMACGLVTNGNLQSRHPWCGLMLNMRDVSKMCHACCCEAGAVVHVAVSVLRRLQV